MTREIKTRLVNLPENVRYIESTDAVFNDNFDCVEESLKLYDIKHYIEQAEDWHVLVRTGKDYYENPVVMAICQFKIYPKYFFIEIIVRNDAIEGSQREGAKLLDVIEYQAEQLKKERIDHRALDREKLIEWYLSREYEIIGDP